MGKLREELDKQERKRKGLAWLQVDSGELSVSLPGDL